MVSFPNTAWNNRAISLPENEQLWAPHALSGLVGYTGTTPVYADSTGMRVKLRAGVTATIRGTHFYNDTETLVTVGANTSGNPRIDLVVLRLRRTESSVGAGDAYTVNPFVIAGVPAATPVAPVPVRNIVRDASGVFDVPLCRVTVPHNAATIPSTAVVNQAWWVTPGGYTGFDTARPPVEPSVTFQANDTGITWVGTAAGTWRRLYHNSGTVNIAAPAGWTPTPYWVSRHGDLVTMNARLVRTGATISEQANPVVGRVPEGFRPWEAQYGVYHCSFPDHSSHVVVLADGGVVFAGTNTTGLHIGQGATLYVAIAPWPAAD